MNKSVIDNSGCFKKSDEEKIVEKKEIIVKKEKKFVKPKIELFNNKLIVKQDLLYSKWIIIPKTAQRAELMRAEGTIIYAAKNLDLDVKVGDYVAYGKYAAWPVLEKETGESDEDIQLFIIDAGDILYKKILPKKQVAKNKIAKENK